MNPPLRRVAHHGPQILVNHRLAAHEEQVADVVLDADVDDVARLLQRHAAPLLGVETVHREPAEIALGVADVGDGELEIARTAMLEHLAEQLENAGLGPDHRTGKIGRRPAGGAAGGLGAMAVVVMKPIGGGPDTGSGRTPVA